LTVFQFALITPIAYYFAYETGNPA